MAVRFSTLVALSPIGLLPACATQVEPDFSVDGGAVFEDDGGFSFPGSGGFGGTVGGGSGGQLLPPLPLTGGTSGTPPMSGECTPGHKICGGLCVTPAPQIGCASTGCVPCPAPPANADAVCAGEECDWSCRQGFTDTGDGCTSSGSGNTGGSGGSFTIPSGGSPSTPGSCTPSNCMGCSVIGPFGCCRDNGTCGCSWVPGGYCL